MYGTNKKEMTILTKLTGVRLANLIAQETPIPALYIQHFRFGKFDPTHSWKEFSRELLWTRFERRPWFGTKVLCDHLYVLWMMLIITDHYVGNYHDGDRSRAKELRLRIEQSLKHEFGKTPFVHFDYHAIQSIWKHPDYPLNNSTLELVRKLMLDVVRSEEVNDPKSQARRRLEKLNKKCPRVAYKKVEVKGESVRTSKFDVWHEWQHVSTAYPWEWYVPGRELQSYFMIPGGENEHPPGWGTLTRFGANQIYHQDLANQDNANRQASEDEVRDYVERLLRVNPAWTKPGTAERPKISFMLLFGDLDFLLKQYLEVATFDETFHKDVGDFYESNFNISRFIGSTVGEWNYLFGQLVEPEPEPARFGASTPIPAAVPKKTLPKESRGSTARAQYLLQAQRDLPELPEDEPEPEPTVVIPEEHDPPTWVEPVTAKVAKPETSMLPLLAVGAVAAVILVR